MTESAIEFLRAVFRETPDAPAVVRGGWAVTFGELDAEIDRRRNDLEAAGMARGDAVAIHSEFNPTSVATLLAVADAGGIVVPVSPTSAEHGSDYEALAGVRYAVAIDSAAPGGALDVQVRVPGAEGRDDDTRVLDELRGSGHPGLVLFSSGSSGRPKGVVHDLTRLLAKYRRRRKCLRTLAFLLFDHIGGVDTLFYNLSNGSCLSIPEGRDPDAVLAAVERHAIEVLPVSPSFLNLVFLSEAHTRHDTSSLRIITYGAEMMPQSTLDRCREAFPGVELMQKYGTSEIGTMRSKSEGAGSLWVKLGGEGYATRVRDGKLEIRAASSMLGYLNAPSPFTDDGWFMTGDLVEHKVVEGDGEYFRFLGRASDVINVGGRKVFPAEVEAVLTADANVAEAAVYGEKMPMLGAIVCAKVRLAEPEEHAAAKARLTRACKEALESYKVPMKLAFTEERLSTERGKVARRQQAQGGASSS